MKRWIFATLLVLLVAGLGGAASAYTLYAGQNIPVGTVSVVNDGTSLVVTYDTDGGWYLEEVHLMVGAMSDATCTWPTGTTSKGNPIPGQFPYNEVFDPTQELVDTTAITIPLSELPQGSFCIAAHTAVVHVTDGCIEVRSDESTLWSADGITYQPAVATWVHPSWPSISGATWIWRTAQTDGPDEYATVPDGGWYFKKEFTIPENAFMISGTIKSDADNSESMEVNGNLIYQDGPLSKDGPDGYEWQTVQTNDISDKLVLGQNTILFRAINYFNYGPYTSNPAGLVFGASGDGICYSVVDQKETGWAATDIGANRFVTKGNWATWVPFPLPV